MPWDSFWVSLRAAFFATVIVTIVGFAVGYWLARSRWRMTGFVEALLSLPVALPPTVVGYYILVCVSRDAPIGAVWYSVTGHELVFTFTGVVIAQAVEALPYGLRAARAAVEDVDTRYEQLAATMGFSAFRRITLVTLPLASGGLLVGTALAFGRALADYGATSMISGGSRETTTMPLAIIDQLFGGSPAAASQLALIQIGLAVVIMVGVSRLGRRHGI